MERVLVVENDPLLLESIAFELEMRAFDVIQASNGTVALTLLQDTNVVPNIILSDIAMPGMDGYQLLAHVRQNERLNGIPFVFLTAFASKSDIIRGKELGVDDYLIKPFNPEDLVIMIKNTLNRVNLS